MNPYLTALKPLRKRHYLGNQLFAAALHNKAGELTLIPALQHREVPALFRMTYSLLISFCESIPLV
jgi:hypothetical protein